VARVEEFQKIEKSRNSVHEVVEAGYLVFTSNDGKTYIQIETYGSSTRKLQDKVSQVIQLDRKSAAELLDIISSAFPDLRR
jgi:hypothetical protein